MFCRRPKGVVSGMEPLSGVGPLRPGWARAWVSLRREAPLSGCYLGCCVLAAARVLLRWSVCTRVALAEKAQAACRRRSLAAGEDLRARGNSGLARVSPAGRRELVPCLGVCCSALLYVCGLHAEGHDQSFAENCRVGSSF